jgi:hypothetical protein
MLCYGERRRNQWNKKVMVLLSAAAAHRLNRPMIPRTVIRKIVNLTSSHRRDPGLGKGGLCCVYCQS